MQIVSTLAFMLLAATYTFAEPERKLLRSGYDSPINFSDLTRLADTSQKHGSPSGVPGVDSTTKSGPLPGADSLPIGGRSGLQSLTGGNGLNSVGKDGKLPSLPISGGSSTRLNKGFLGGPDNLSGLTDGLGLPPTTTTSTRGKKTYSSGDVDKSEDRALTRLKTTPSPSPKQRSMKTKKKTTTNKKKSTNKKKTTKTNQMKMFPNKFPRPNVKKTPTPDPEKSPVKRLVV
uniref:RxLR effector protein n=1 Tax=Phytophthora ramorum TaxID=164328 RepID=H3H3H3_PHYRM